MENKILKYDVKFQKYISEYLDDDSFDNFKLNKINPNFDLNEDEFELNLKNKNKILNLNDEKYKNELEKRLKNHKKYRKYKKYIKNFIKKQTDEFEEINITRQIENNEKNMGKKIGVYIRTNSEGYIIDVNSDIYLKDFSDWKKIDEGYGDRFANAQNLYFGISLINENGNYRYKI